MPSRIPLSEGSKEVLRSASNMETPEPLIRGVSSQKPPQPPSEKGRFPDHQELVAASSGDGIDDSLKAVDEAAKLEDSAGLKVERTPHEPKDTMSYEDGHSTVERHPVPNLVKSLEPIKKAISRHTTSPEFEEDSVATVKNTRASDILPILEYKGKPGSKTFEIPNEIAVEQRAEDAAKKVQEYGRYMLMLEQRVASLEARHDNPTKTGEGPEKSSSTKKPSERQPAVPELRREGWTDFKNKLKGDKRVYAIEALVGEERFYYQRTKQMKPNANTTDPPNAIDSGIQLKQSSLGYVTDQKAFVRRIRINSHPIVAILAEIADVDWTEEPTVLLYPFKLLVHHENAIRMAVKRLETRWGAVDRESSVRGAKPYSIETTENDTMKGENPDLDGEPTNEDSGIKHNDKRSSEENHSICNDNNDPNNGPELEELSDSVEALRDMRCLIRFMNEELTPVLGRIREFSISRIYFRDLWHLFRPGDFIYFPPRNLSGEDHTRDSSVQGTEDHPNASHKQNGHYQEDWRIISVGDGRHNLSSDSSDDNIPPKHKINPFSVCMYYIDFDGTKFKAVVHRIGIKPFDGERDITSLQFYPASFVKDIEQRKKMLKERGRMFRDLTTFKHRHCVGSSLACHPCGCAYSKELPRNSEPIDSPVVVDFAEAIQTEPNWSPDFTGRDYSWGNEREFEDSVSISVWEDIEQKELDSTIDDVIYSDSFEDDMMTHDFVANDPLLREEADPSFLEGRGLRDEDLILLPARVLAFVFRHRKFAALHIDSLRQVRPYKKGWNDLILPKGHKDMLRALVKTHLRGKSPYSADVADDHDHDIVRGKGQGLVVLLHGVPGVGKTSTAECIAESNGKPLFPITCGDLGLTAASVEKELEKNFHLAQAWDCVLLLDEADVFLAERTRADIKRNSLVSVFLRVLEYFTGILFLTTNRVGIFDDAFKSRIHLPLYFPPLKEQQTLEIWKHNLSRTLERKEPFLEADEEGILAFAKSQYHHGKLNDTNWNGRQIRNAFQTATALAEFDAQAASARQLKDRKNGAKAPVYARLHTRHFNIVAQASQQFDEYINSFGASLADRALQKADRNDAFKQISSKWDDQIPPGVYIPPKPTKAQKSRKEDQSASGSSILRPVAKQKVALIRTPQSRNRHQSGFEDEDIAQLQTPTYQRQKAQRAAPQIFRTASSSRTKQSSQFGYPTPTTPGSGEYDQGNPSDNFLQYREPATAETMPRQARPRVTAGRFPVATDRLESEEGSDYGAENSEEEEEEMPENDGR